MRDGVGDCSHGRCRNDFRLVRNGWVATCSWQCSWPFLVLRMVLIVVRVVRGTKVWEVIFALAIAVLLEAAEVEVVVPLGATDKRK